MIRMLAGAVPAMMFAVAAPPAMAESMEPAPSCLSVFADIWGEKEPRTSSREIDGETIKTPADFMRITGTREAGFKIIKGGDFSGWDFSGIPLSHVCFNESKLTGANFFGVKAEGVGFIKSDLSGANLRQADMARVLFRNTKLSAVRARGANFTNGHFDGGWFEGSIDGWNIDAANLSGFTFECGITVPDGCPVYAGREPMSARKTNFTGAILHSFGLFGVDIDGAIVDRTIIGPAQLSDLTKANIRGDIILRGGNNDIRISAIETVRLQSANARQRARNANPSFDCTKARTILEKKICGENESDLRALDRDVAALYHQAKRRHKNIKVGQFSWLHERNKCNEAQFVADCLRDSYDARKGALLAILGGLEWLERGKEALFVDELLPVSAAFTKTPYYDKILPALVGASMTEILVKRGEDGLYSIVGSSVGANAHTCSISASHLYFDKQSGWYAPVSEDKIIPIFRYYNDRLEIFENGRPDYEKYPDMGDYVSCGMRASFRETHRIKADPSTIAKIRKRFDQIM